MYSRGVTVGNEHGIYCVQSVNRRKFHMRKKIAIGTLSLMFLMGIAIIGWSQDGGTQGPGPRQGQHQWGGGQQRFGKDGGGGFGGQEREGGPGGRGMGWQRGGGRGGFGS